MQITGTPVRRLTIEQAEAQRYGPLTNAYGADEAWMLAAVERDMQRGGISYVLVEEEQNAFAVWRKGMVRESAASRMDVNRKVATR